MKSFVATIAVLLLSVATVARGALLAGQQESKHHHDLRGVISNVEPEKNQFEIKTDASRVVLCVIDDKTTIKRGTKQVTLSDARPGERARCHCVALKDGRHYSQSLLLEQKRK